jgi:hypothetical protein
MSRCLAPVLLVGLTMALAAAAPAAQQSSRPGQPARDTSAGQTPAGQAPAPPKGRISGRVLTADTGRPVKRARVFVSAAELPNGVGVLTDDSGAFELGDLPGGRYNLSVSKSGYVSLAYGQRRPFQAGTPLQLAEGQQMRGIDFRLPRGSVVSGRVYDEDGDSMAGVMVRVLRSESVQNGHRLVPTGSAQTDDRGQFRIWGLMPGEYYVDAQARLNLPGGRGALGLVPAAAIAGVLGQFGAPTFAALFESEEPDQKSYAPTFYPGVTVVDEARAVTVGIGQELADIDFSLRLVRVARVSGRVVRADGSATSNGNVTLVADAAVQRGSSFGISYTSRIDWDGSFAIPSVPPGRYVLRARGDEGGAPRFASQPITIGNGDLSDLSIMVTPGASISGRVVFTPGASPASLTDVRIAAPSLDQQAGGLQARPEKDGTFTIGALPPGPLLIRPDSVPPGWMLRSVALDGRDVTDTPIEVRSGQALSNVTVTLTDKVGELNGTITSDRGEPVIDYTVLAFTTDRSLWRPQSRHILTARPDQTGGFRMRGLPPGEYYVVVVDPAQQGEWFQPAYLEEHRTGAIRVSLGEGDSKTQNFTVRTGG